MVQNLPRETRDGSQRMGESMLNLVQSLYQNPILAQYRDRIKQKKSFGHPAIVFTMIGHHLGVPQENTTLYYLYSTVSSLVQNAVRAIPLGQTAGQKVIQEFQVALAEGNRQNPKFGRRGFWHCFSRFGIIPNDA